ncbi:type II-B CRISPR-associated RNA-guided endonuclease Cas9/Csx12 [Leptospira fletcheri]|uniref:Type II-B CRISPR-associated RNA-guided endonuclease Cas9/Csx12 n=1 Tax=Leptospira fletcheri TaxID=2484981 RepID=A0A4V3JDX2_9LEPT|nr:type II-B CRISPR-associated RNA-guided endonuclease Cas9/Csx12 [Leptospira fletcheri]TGK12365.1 type II-B CRISPR-associated RNA-guided endonuclease Cas9/Csx12 [Leptospira fletcheri]
MILKSPIAIDLGAKNTGVVYTTYPPHSKPQGIHGATLILDNLKLSQVDRRAKRHQRRNYSRMRLARRLVYLIVRSHYKVPENDLTPEVKVELQSLLTRRGYTFQSVVTESNEHGQTAWAEIEDYFPKMQIQDKSLPIQTILDSFFSSENIRLEYLEPIKEAETKDDKNHLKMIREQKEAFEAEQNNGARHRIRYFEEIEEDLPRKIKLLECLKKNKIDEKRFLNLIQNISNLQIKPLRDYFNDKNMKEKEIWDPKKLHSSIAGWIRVWHADSKDAEKRNIAKKLLSLLENGRLKAIRGNSTYSTLKHIINFLEEVDPKDTIPPYEDQNNRKPPKCQNLWLDPGILDRYFPGWSGSLQKLLAKEEDSPFEQLVTKDFQINETTEEGKSLLTLIKLYSRAHSDKELDVRAIILQRFLDRSANLDPWSIRLQRKASKEIKITGSLTKQELKKASDAYERMKETIGETDAKQFLDLSGHYYREVEDIKKGMWFSPDSDKKHKEIPKSIVHEENDEVSLFYKCDTKTGSKQKNLSSLVGNVLNVRFSAELFRSFLTFWTEKFDGRSSLNSLAKSIEEARLSTDEFGVEYSILLKKIEKGEIDRKSDIFKAYQNTTKSSGRLEQILKEELGFQAISKSYFDNPFSIAQLYNIISVDRSGFSKVCRSCQEENHWRSTLIDTDRGLRAWASKQVSDTGRPFDGQIAMLLDRIALEVVRLKKAEIEQYLKSNPSKIESVEIPLLIEENSFSFRYELAELKKLAKKKREQLGKSVEEFDKRLNTKQDRIKEASREICPYTGKRISKGEIDHILPRSQTQKQFGTVFNAEVNLIYVSREGNQAKGKRDYSLDDLDEKYLKKIFGTKDLTFIKKTISETVDRLVSSRKNSILVFDRLSMEEQDCLRHALFEKPLRPKVFELLSGQLKARVNGTQLYLAKKIRNLLRKDQDLPKIKFPQFSFFEPRGIDLPYMRRELAQKFPNLEKQNPQPTGSHIVDAAMVMAYAVETDSGSLSYGSKSGSERFDSELLSKYLPNDIRFLRIKSKEKTNSRYPHKKPLFKDGVFGERFLPILVLENGLRLGYTLENSLELSPQDSKKFFEVLRSVLLFKRKPVSHDYPALSSFAKKDKRKYIVLPVNKAKALEVVSQKEHSLLASILKSISYTVFRTPVVSFLFDQKKELIPKIRGKKVDWGEKIEKEFRIKIEVKLGDVKITSGFIQYPGKSEWEKLLLSDSLRGAIKNKSLTLKWFDSRENLSKLDGFFKDTSEPKAKHKRRSNHYALSVPKSPSGRFRIRRNSFDDYKIYQLYSVEGNAFNAFEINTETKENPILLDVYKNSNSVTYADKDYIYPTSGETIAFSEYREIVFKPEERKNLLSTGIISLHIAPGTADRRYIRIVISKDFFSKIFKVKDSFWELALNESIPKENIEKLSLILDKIPSEKRPGMPRSDAPKLNVTKIAVNSVELSYTSPSWKSWLSSYNDSI